MMKKPTGMLDSWFELLKPLFEDKRFNMLKEWLVKQKPFSPDFKKVFRIFSMIEPQDVRAVIVGLSPYQGVKNGEKVATGIPFGVKDQTYDTPSLRCIRDGLAMDTGIITIEDTFDWTLESWIEQGVFMFNIAFTVKTGGNARSHLAQWDWFSRGLLQILNNLDTGLPFVFMGSDAQKLSNEIDESKHHIFKVYHPAAASYGKGYNMATQKVFENINKVIENINGEKFKINFLENDY